MGKPKVLDMTGRFKVRTDAGLLNGKPDTGPLKEDGAWELVYKGKIPTTATYVTAEIVDWKIKSAG